MFRLWSQPLISFPKLMINCLLIFHLIVILSILFIFYSYKVRYSICQRKVYQFIHIPYKDHKSVIKHILCDQKHIIHYSLSNSKQSPMQFMTFKSRIMLGVLMIDDLFVVLPFSWQQPHLLSVATLRISFG